MGFESGQALFEQNRDVLGTYKVNQNVILHPQPARFDNKMYGHISGFCLNTVGEVILEITIAQVPTMYVENKIIRAHPLNSLLIIEKV